ncbi:hypothetical protein PUN28_020890 [Cardiocondyla obscurior]|uniref:Uncharacterized protein n=1 Tax=Cardiocondyla obscurior TaxID=286306 RepID=A0AAW2EAW3_9HYME
MAKKQKKIFLKFYNVALCGIQNRCIQAYSEPSIFIRSRDMAKNEKNIFEILQRSIMHSGLFELSIFIRSRDMAKNEKTFLKFSYSRDMAKKQKEMFLKFCNIALCGIQNRCIRAYSELFLFIRSRDMAKKRKKIFLKFCNVAFRDMAKNEKNIFEILQRSIVRHLKRCIRAYSEPSIFTSSRDMAKKQKNIFKFCNIALCGIQNRCIRAYLESRDMAKKRKKIFLKFYNVAFRDMAKKQKKIFLKFCNIALCGIQNRCIRAYSNIVRHSKKCIRAYSEPSIFTRAEIWPKNKKIFLNFQPRYGQKTKKNIFENWQHSIVRHSKKMHTGLLQVFYFHQSQDMAKKQKEMFLKFCNIALCGIQNRCIRAYSEFFLFIRSRDMAKKRKKIFLKFCNVALCATKNRCIRDYSELCIFTSSRNISKKRK